MYNSVRFYLQRTAHPSLIQRVNQLELKNRHLQNVIKQQQQYTDSIMQRKPYQINNLIIMHKYIINDPMLF